ncbi:MAG: ATP-binding protein [Rhizomicrobium sp.]|nr:ATP-binding protein [Rhizomicrobium sp.]
MAAPYALALLLVAAALASTLLLQTVYVGRPPLFPFFAAIAAAAWFGGKGPGYFASAVSVPLGLYFYVVARPDHDLHFRDFLLFVFFATCAFLGGALNSRHRKTEDGLRSAHRDLQAKATELQHANDALLAEMAERRRTEATLEAMRSKLGRVMRLTTMAEMAASIAHEINQPLTAIVTNGETCVRWLNAAEPNIAEAQDAAKRAVRDAERASQVVSRIRAMVRNALADREQVSLQACLDDVLALLLADLTAHQIEIRCEVPPALPTLFGDRIQLQQVFFNLLTNAIESLSETTGRQRDITISAERGRENTVVILLRDNGAGFQDCEPEQLFDSFVTTKPSGMGMGLSISRTIVETHGGTLTASRAIPHGAAFAITLPLSGEEP